MVDLRQAAEIFRVLTAGEDSFACPDAFTYDWVIGQFPEKCFPVLGELIESY